MTEKPRYPAHLWPKRLNYPAKYCNACGKRLTPSLSASGNLEAPTMFKRRKYCSRRCAASTRTLKAKAVPATPFTRQHVRRALGKAAEPKPPADELLSGKIVAALEHGSLCRAELERVTGMSERMVKFWLGYLKSKGRVVAKKNRQGDVVYELRER